MSEQLAGIDEANQRGFIQGLAVARRLVQEESKYRDQAVKENAARICEKLTEMIERATPHE